MSQAKVAAEHGSEIARVLRLRKASGLVHPSNRRLFAKVMAELARHPGGAALPRLEGLFRQVQRRQEVQTAVALLDLSWLIEPGSRLEEDVFALLRRCYLDAPREEWRLQIRDELRDRQMHPFPSVRRVVHRVRQVDPVDEVEVYEIREIERGYPDVRASIAERIVVHGQLTHLDAVIHYLCGILLLAHADPAERRHAKALFSRLALRFPQSEPALEILYRAYIQRYSQIEPRGYLMLAIGRYDDAITPQLLETYHSHPADRTAIVHVLMQIVSWGGLEATRAMLQIVRDAANIGEMDWACEQLAKALETLSNRVECAAQAEGVRAIVEESLPIIQRRNFPSVRDLVDRYRNLSRGESTIHSLVATFLAGEASDVHRQKLRRAWRTAEPILLAVARDTERDPDQRRRALETIGTLHPAARPSLARDVWALFRQEENEAVQVAAVRALAALELDPGEEARDQLFALLQTSSATLAGEIRKGWDRMFHPSDLGGQRP